MALENDDGGAGAGEAGSAADFTGGAGAADAGAGAGAGEGGAADAGGTGDAGAGAGEGGAADGGAGGAADPDWYGQIPADVGEGEKTSLRDWLKAAEIKDVAGLAKVARDNQLALRESGRIKVPGSGASPEEVAQFHQAIGVPEDAKGYELPQPKGEDGEPLPLNTAMLERIADSAHKLGIPKAALEGILGAEVQAQLDDLHAEETAISARAAAHVKKWGGEANEKLAAVDSALSALGVNKAESLALRAALGPERALDIFSRLGAGLSEDRFVSGDDTRKFGISGEAAQGEMDKLKADSAFMEKVRIKGSAEQVRWNRLQDAAGAAADRKAAMRG